jgi:hypothetical protein
MYAIKAEIGNPSASSWTFTAHRTMYGGKRIGKGDTIFIFASGSDEGAGLVARGVVSGAQATPLRPGVPRQTPCVSIAVTSTGSATRRLGRRELKPFDRWHDGRPETELNFKFYRQATDKIVGLSEVAAAYLGGFFEAAGPA